MDYIVNCHNTSYTSLFYIEDNIVCYDGFKIKYELNNTDYNLTPIDHIAFHMLRIANIGTNKFTDLNQKIYEIKKNNLVKFIKKINNIVSTGYHNYCTSCCSVVKKTTKNTINYCDNYEECITNWYYTPTDDLIYNTYKNDNKKLMFLVNLTIGGLFFKYAGDVYNPLPKIKNCLTIESIKNAVPTSTILNESNKFDDCTNEYELFLKCTQHEYSFYKNAMLSNHFSILPVNINDGIKDDVTIFSINYDAEKENEYANKASSYLFHGSSLPCWYSIVKNGIKNMSGTKFQACGAAYGNGIYLSDSYNFSLGYSRNNQIEGFHVESQIQVVAVFQIFTDIEKIKKTTNIFVLENEKQILLRNLIVTNSSNHLSVSKSIKFIDAYFNVTNTKKHEDNKVKINMIKFKRLNNEHEILKNNNKYEIDTIYSNSEAIWNVKIKNNKNINIKFIFSNYPISVPVVYIQKLDNTINNNVKLDIPILSPITWNLQNNIKNILENIEHVMVNF